jgi:hypothetical protein
MLIATPLIVDKYVRNIPKGSETSLRQMRKDLAAEYHAAYTCPITSGIFLRIVAEVACEEYRQGKPLSKITPFWRMIDSKSPAAKKTHFRVRFCKGAKEEREADYIKKSPAMNGRLSHSRY